MRKQIPIKTTSNDVKRFWSMVHKSESGCWIWMGGPKCDRTPIFYIESGLHTTACRVACHITGIEAETFLHADCGNKKCVNPEHRTRKPWVGKGGYMEIGVSRGSFFEPMCKSGKRGSGQLVICYHRLVMAKHLGRCLESWEVVHHKNHIRTDNRIENLELISSATAHHPETITHSCMLKMKEQIKQLKDSLKTVVECCFELDGLND